jgi:RES domain-containing protein
LTPEDRALDPDFFLTHQPLTLFRLAKAKHANLSGVGASTAPGRWNRFGQEAIYTSTEMGVPVLERLVHTPKDRIPSDLAMMKIRVSGQWIRQGSFLVAPNTGAMLFVAQTLLEARARHGFFVGFDAFAMAVPSIIVPVWNVVLYPQGKSFWDHVSLENIEPFEFDPRLFPDDTPVESASAE